MIPSDYYYDTVRICMSFSCYAAGYVSQAVAEDDQLVKFYIWTIVHYAILQPCTHHSWVFHPNTLSLSISISSTTSHISSTTHISERLVDCE